jgi:hypothetical protein
MKAIRKKFSTNTDIKTGSFLATWKEGLYIVNYCFLLYTLLIELK